MGYFCPICGFEKEHYFALGCGHFVCEECGTNIAAHSVVALSVFDIPKEELQKCKKSFIICPCCDLASDYHTVQKVGFVSEQCYPMRVPIPENMKKGKILAESQRLVKMANEFDQIELEDADVAVRELFEMMDEMHKVLDEMEKSVLREVCCACDTLIGKQKLFGSIADVERGVEPIMFEGALPLQMDAEARVVFPKRLESVVEEEGVWWECESVYPSLGRYFVAFLKDQVENDNPFAEFVLGQCYSKARYTRFDPEEALRLFERAGHHGHVEAQFQAGEMYASGLGAPQNIAQARIWWQRAAENRHESAPIRLRETAYMQL